MFRKIALLFLVLLTIHLHTRAQTEARLSIKTQGAKQITVTAAEIASLPQADISYPDKSANQHTYRGVSLYSLLEHYDKSLSELKGDNLMKVVIAKALDGYEVVFALAELNPALSDRKIILALSCDGKALSKDEAPFRIIVEGAKKHARSVRQLSGLTILNAIKP